MFDAKALAAFRSTLAVNAAGLAERDVPALLRQTARDERARVLREQRIRAGGWLPTDVTIPDGRRGAPIDVAQRVVIIEYGYLREVTAGIMRELRLRAPLRSGRYRRSFVMLVNGAEQQNTNAIQHDTKEAIIVNTAPYARRLEIGKRRDGTPFVVQVPQRLVEQVALAARKRFSAVAAVTFGYFELHGDRVARRAGARRGRRTARPMRYPGIRIVVP